MGGAAERFQEHVNAAVVAGRERPSGDPLSGDDRADSRRRDPQRHSRADTGIGHQRRRKATELRQHPCPSELSSGHIPRRYPAYAQTIFNDRAPPAICGHPQIFAAPDSDSGGSLPSDLGSNTAASRTASNERYPSVAFTSVARTASTSCCSDRAAASSLTEFLPWTWRVTSTIRGSGTVPACAGGRRYPRASVATSSMAKPRSVASRSTLRRMPRPSG